VSLRIGIDLMGGDSPPSFLFEAVILAAGQTATDVRFDLFASDEWCKSLATSHHPSTKECLARLEFHPCKEVISMGDAPLLAVRRKKNSSLLMGLRALKNNLIDAFISAGNTGALLAGASLLVPKIPGILRPALLAVLPTKKRPMAIVDVGGNVTATALHMVQFALLGLAYCSVALQRSQPSIALLNVGIESKKGTRTHQDVYNLLQTLSASSSPGPELFRFLGNVEGRNVFDGHIDVLVTDGFAGNVFLKTVEGTASFMLDLFESYFQKGPAEPKHISNIDALKREFSYTEYPGALLAGIDGLVVKCHGEASTRSIYHAIMNAITLVESQFIPKAKEWLCQR
jgi:glycerol-3-phosphate acyltransferase PlsX